jgi:hypothetical protein
VAAGVVTPYSTVAPFFGAPPAWVPTLEQERIQSYLVYEDIYWSRPDTFKLVARGTEDKPIYVPSGRIIVDTLNRYIGRGLDFYVDPAFGEQAAQEAARLAFTNLFRREKFKSRYAANKRFGLIRGDWLWHIVADPLKPQGSRISILPVDPASWFPVYADDDPGRLVKVHLAEQYVTPDGKDRIKRLTYERLENGLIQRSEGIFEVKDWNLRTVPEAVTLPPATLPPQVTAFPVYQIRNQEEPQNPYGSSELRGLERLMSAINQAISDEDLALALEGLGVYATDGGGPVDEEGNDVPWAIGPGRVVENALNFRRVGGIGSVTPYQDHLGMLINMLKDASGATDAAIGKVDVQVAESGVALALHLAPTLAKAEERDQEIIDVHAQMFYDLVNAWFPVYEGLTFTGVQVLPVLGEKVPQNKKAEVEAILLMVEAKVMSVTTARERLAALGYVFAPDEAQRVVQEAALTAETTDPLAARMDTELQTIGGAGEEA